LRYLRSSSNFAGVQFKPPLYKERWKHIVKTIQKRATTLTDIHTEVFGMDV
jgi:hypothetical protein